MEIKKVDVPCFRCKSSFKGFAKVNKSGRVQEYIELIGGQRRRYPDSSRTNYCDSCLPEIDKLIAEISPKCHICSKPVTLDLLRGHIGSEFTDKASGNTYHFCSGECLGEYRKDLNEEKDATAKRLKEFTTANPPPDYPAAFTDEKTYGDNTLLVWVRSLPQGLFNKFIGRLLDLIRNSTWVASADNEGVFKWERRLSERAILLLSKNMPEWIVPLPLPMCVWNWLEAGGEPLVFEKSDQTGGLGKPKRGSYGAD